MKFLSLGAGVQSTVLLMMAIKGEIDRPDHVIFADTGFEPKRVYEHLGWCKRQCEKANLPFHVVKAKYDMREGFHMMESGEKYNWRSRPAIFITGDRTEVGISMRQCTAEAKVAPLNKKQVQLAGHKTARTCADGEIVTMIGISTDEARRASPSRVRWIERDYPLIDPLKMSRADCQSWWEHNFPHINLPTSSCTICPYHSDRMWKAMKETQPEDWAEAVDYDERIRHAYQHAQNATGDRKPQNVYLHPSCTALKEVDFGMSQGALDLDDAIYCSGGCGL